MNIIRTDRPARRSAPARNQFGLYRDLNELFDTFFQESKQESTTYLPAVNIAEEADNFLIEVSAPGYKKEELNISVEDNMLSINAERKEEHEHKDRKFSRREFSYGSFRRSFTLPETVNSDEITCKYEDGVLNIRLPKREEAKAKPRRDIEIG